MAEIEEWQDRLLLTAENALRARPEDEQVKEVKRKIEEMGLDFDNRSARCFVKRAFSATGP